MDDKFGRHKTELTGPLRSGVIADFGSNDFNFDFVTRAIYVSSAGSATVLLMENENDLVLENLQVGQLLPFRVKTIRQQTTSAAGIIGFW